MVACHCSAAEEGIQLGVTLLPHNQALQGHAVIGRVQQQTCALCRRGKGHNPQRLGLSVEAQHTASHPGTSKSEVCHVVHAALTETSSIVPALISSCAWCGLPLVVYSKSSHKSIWTLRRC